MSTAIEHLKSIIEDLEKMKLKSKRTGDYRIGLHHAILAIQDKIDSLNKTT